MCQTINRTLNKVSSNMKMNDLREGNNSGKRGCWRWKIGLTNSKGKYREIGWFRGCGMHSYVANNASNQAQRKGGSVVNFQQD